MKLISLFENSSSLTKDQARKIIQDCKPFINEVIDIEENVIYRGLQMESFKVRSETIASNVFKAKVRKDRVPLNTKTFIHKSIDDWMNIHFGKKYRSQSIFCAADRKTVLNFGKPYIILPIGQFSYVWSPFIEDLYSDVVEINSNKFTEHNVDEKLDEILENAQYKNTDLTDAIINYPSHEIMIECEEYYAFEPSTYFDYFYNYYRLLV